MFMKNNWQIKKLGEVCEISTGKSNANEAVEDGEYAFFDRSRTIKRSTRFLFDCEAIIIPGEGQEFFPKYYKGKFDLHQRAYALYNFNEKVDIQFIYKYLIHFHKYFENVAVGATAKSLRLRHFEELPFPLPPLSEQKQIVRILDEVFEKTVLVKETAENNLQNARELFESYLQSVFANPGEDWKTQSLGEVCKEIFAGGDVPKSSSSKTKTDKYKIPIFANGETNKGLYGYTDQARVFEPSITVSARGTIGYSEIRHEPYFPVVRLIVLIPRQEVVTLPFLKYVVGTINFKNSGTSIPQLTVPMIKVYKFCLPQIVDQKRIVTKLDCLSTEIKKLEAIYQRKLSNLEELKKSVLHKAFNGELAGVCS